VTEEDTSQNTRTRWGAPGQAPSPPLAERGRLRALYEWLVGATPAPGADPAVAVMASPPAGAPTRIGRYSIVRKLGEGGMGVVYAARDERLERTVAIKRLSSLVPDETARQRFWREARAAASVNHPNVCQLYEVGEDGGELFIAMELLEGEALSERLRRGALNLAEAMPVGLGVLAALQALHARGIVHRDLKPSNVFVTPHGVKLLDFGLARPSEAGALALDSLSQLTRSGMVVGTPRYMAPEQITGEAVDARSDLFAMGAMLFEMLAGRPAFEGGNAVEILHATLYEQPPALTGSPAVAAADRVIRKALSKRPSDRPPSAEALAEELRAALRSFDDDITPAVARPLTRLVVLPFRILRSDPETDFLAFSLADAIATSLSTIASLVVRSTATATRLGGESPDLEALATEADVDLVVMGTLLRAGDQIRATAQLVEAPAGTLLTAHTVQSPLGDLFKLQDDIAQRVVGALSLPLAGRGAASTPDVPRNARAYEFYLRANELARNYDQISVARDMYLRCLEEDPSFAPAWAHAGRCHRVIGKYIEDSAGNYARAEQAFRRALELSPRLSVAHKYYAHLQADTGHAQLALVRLVDEASRRGNDPELFAGLVHACRYCGLYEQSMAAHEEARRLDPHVPTSLEQTLLMTGDLQRLLEIESVETTAPVMALAFVGRRDEARAMLRGRRDLSQLSSYRTWVDLLMAWIDGSTQELLVPGPGGASGLQILEDPEAIFQEGWMLCANGEHGLGLGRLQRAVSGGFFAAATLSRDRNFDALRGQPAFQALLAEAESRRQDALAAFREAGGERLLGS
jgi:eukaryotic-like serine/threonine-protein kinase